MSSTRFAIGLSLFLATTGWLLVRPGPPVAQAAQTVQFDAFEEDASAHRYVTSQARHWRHLLIKK